MGKCSSKDVPHVPSKAQDHNSSSSYRQHEKVLIQHHKSHVQSRYREDPRHLSVGSNSVVSRASHHTTGAIYALTSVSKVRNKNLIRLQREVEMMRKMDHPNIVKLHETFEDPRSIWLVLELCSGGHMLDRIVELGSFTEARAAICIQQILRALCYMHEDRVCHRDLKPDNLMFLNKSPIEDNPLKVIDVGFARKVHADQPLHTKCGSPYFSAPQVLAGKYDESADLWSVGVIMYILLCGYPPFSGETPKDAIAAVRRGTFTFPEKQWAIVSDDAKHLVNHLLKKNPQNRYKAPEALNHAWILQTGIKEQASLDCDFFNNLRSFRSANKLKKVALQIIANQLDEDEIASLRKTFLALDANGDGLLTAAEIEQSLPNMGIETVPEDLRELLADLDSDKSGVIDYSEFLAAALEQKQYLQEHVLWNAFTVFDNDGDGKITMQELTQVLTSGSLANSFSPQEVDEVLRQVDLSGDACIDFEEFVVTMTNGPLKSHGKFAV